MNKLTTAALAAGLSIAGLAGCSGSTSDAGPSPSPSAVSPSAAATPEASTPAETTPSTPSPSASTSSTPAEPAPSEAAPSKGLDQSTPEAVMTEWVNALVAGKAGDVCTLTAANGKRFSDIANGQKQCTERLSGISSSVKPLADALKGLTIKGATVKGDKADFTKAKTTPEIASALVKNFKATKIDGKWYVTVA